MEKLYRAYLIKDGEGRNRKEPVKQSWQGTINVNRYIQCSLSEEELYLESFEEVKKYVRRDI
jgi:hypothetical protein